MRTVRTLALFALASCSLLAQPVQQAPGRNDWLLDTGSFSHVAGVNSRGEFVPVHWGARVTSLADFGAAPASSGLSSFESGQDMTPNAFPAFGGLRFPEPCLKATFAEGARDVVLKFDPASVEGDRPVVLLQGCPRRIEGHAVVST